MAPLVDIAMAGGRWIWLAAADMLGTCGLTREDVLLRLYPSFRLARGAYLLGAIFAAAGFSPAVAATCEPETFEQASYVVCAATAGSDDLRLFWKGDDGQPFRTFSKLADTLKAKGRTLVFAMNAGMYKPDFTPIGLFVENGVELRPADTAEIRKPPGQVPNFYKKPNGVFLLDEAGARIMTTDAFLKSRPTARFATQSGPMLVIDGKLHPALIAGSTDRTRRSGAGTCDDGTVRFAISDDDVNFYDFARLFRDHLHCRNALFLDGGNGAGLYEAATGQEDHSWHGGYGPIVGLVTAGAQ